MQLLDDDMDELFRKAASDYPLNTGGGDWEAMRNRLQQAENNQQGTATGRLKGRWWFKPGLFVIMTALLLITAVKGLYDGQRLQPGSNDMTLHNPGAQLVTAKGPATGTTTTQDTDREVINNDETQQNSKEEEVVKEGRFTQENNTGTGSRNRQDANEHVVGDDRRKVTEQYTGERLTGEDSEQSSVNRKTGNNATRTRVTQHVPISSYPAAAQGITAVNNIPFSIDRIAGTPDRATVPAVNILHANNGIRVPATVLSDSNVTVPAKKVKQAPASLKKGLYYGLTLSPDITTVKMQRTSNVGYNIGLIAGYRFSKRLAVETGVIYERKYYYSIGKHFNTKNTPWPSNSKIIDVDGWCNMYEIPLNVRYTFSINAKSSWYVNGGISSYIMKKQGYDYTYDYYGTRVKRNWEYNTSTKDWLSNVHVGVGYERPVGVLGTLRVEPYVMIPLKGIGVGELPVTSAGLNIGLTRPLRLK